jgi:hypothetical protein
MWPVIIIAVVAVPLLVLRVDAGPGPLTTTVIGAYVRGAQPVSTPASIRRLRASMNSIASCLYAFVRTDVSRQRDAVKPSKGMKSLTAE